MEKRVKISVRNIVEFVLRSGNIDAAYMGAKRAQEGVRIHQMLQRRRKREAALNGLRYESEVFLQTDFQHRGFDFHIEGRADGIMTVPSTEPDLEPTSVAAPDFAVIEEIKSTLRPLEFIEDDPEHWHWAQVKLYGYMYAAQNAMDKIGLRLTYCHVETEELLEFKLSWTFEELLAFFTGIVENYYDFAQMDFDRLKTRIETAAALKFPYAAYRKGQRELASAAYRAIKNRTGLYAQAPTGTGKTISTLYPAIKALEQDGKIFYLTAKTMTRRVAEDALSLMREKGLVMRSVSLTAKDKLCMNTERKCNPEDCEYARGHFDRVNDAIKDIITNENCIFREQLEHYAKKHMVCPFELSLDAAMFCDCIICDYNHVYDPKVQLKRFFGDPGQKSYILLNDEAHNLVERARDMFSAELSRERFMAVRPRFKGKPLHKAIGAVKKYFDTLELGIEVSENLPETLIHALMDFAAKADLWLVENGNNPGGAELTNELLELYFAVLDFLRTADLYDSRYITFIECTGRKASIKLLCLDPSFLLARTHKTCAPVFFSATLTPLKYFRDVFGGEAGDYGVRMSSPFPRENLCLVVEPNISTAYRNRAASVSAVAERIFEMASAKRGNYFAFFSSYEYMNSVFRRFREKYPDIEAIMQESGLSEQYRAGFLEKFAPGGSLLGFVVMGGIFSEGIDLVGDRLIGAAVAGVGLPLVTAERNVLAEYYNERSGNGFDYAYVYPGMNKVMQAAGRVIRSENDRGVILLIDSRFGTDEYRELFPEEWERFIRLGRGASLTAVLEEFWRDADEYSVDDSL